MTQEDVFFLSPDKHEELEKELKDLREKAMELAKRIDDARQMGDLSENAEYHTAREEMMWTQSRIKEIDVILGNCQIIASGKSNTVVVGSTIKVSLNGQEKEYTIVGAQEADPLHGKISNESPLGSALLGKKKGDKVEVVVPAGPQKYQILDIK